jgi:hypothetical protein
VRAFDDHLTATSSACDASRNCPRDNALTGVWKADGSPNVTLFANNASHLQSTLILGDLGAVTTVGQAGYRLRVVSGIDLAPVAFQDGTIASSHNPQRRLELTVDPAGRPVSADEARSLAGTIDGVPGTATGVIDSATA